MPDLNTTWSCGYHIFYGILHWNYTRSFSYNFFVKLSLYNNVTLNFIVYVLQIQGSQVPSRPGPILSWRLFSSLLLNHSRRVVVSYKRKYVPKYWLTALSSLPIAVDLGRKATKQTKTNIHVHKKCRQQEIKDIFNFLLDIE